MKLTNRQLFFVLGLLLLVIVLLPVVIGMLVGNMMASGMMNSGMMNSGMMGSGQISGGNWGMMQALGSLRIIAILAALIVGGLLLVRALTDLSPRRGDGTTALELLQRRYAAGEITQAEYQRMRQELMPQATLQPR